MTSSRSMRRGHGARWAASSRAPAVLGLEVPNGRCALSGAAAVASLQAGVAQLVEQLIRNQQVIGSSPIAGSKVFSKSWKRVRARELRAQRASRSQLH